VSGGGGTDAAARDCSSEGKLVHQCAHANKSAFQIQTNKPKTAQENSALLSMKELQLLVASIGAVAACSIEI
jgi:hypothetical protein